MGLVVNYHDPNPVDVSLCPGALGETVVRVLVGGVGAGPMMGLAGSPASGSFFSAGVTTRSILSSLSAGSEHFNGDCYPHLSTITLDGPDPLVVE
jgi:hypothetical protein